MPSGTHDFQNILVNSSVSGEIIVTGNFISNSTAVGILIIVSDEFNTLYIHGVHVESVVTTVIRGLSSSVYCNSVSVFIITGSGFPFRRCAMKPTKISISERKFWYTMNARNAA